jgi:putative tryptophan/tyrosine transport system substrate-binding protein
MKRREFITLVGGAAAAWPLTARAQQPVMPVIGLLGSASSLRSRDLVAAFHRGLQTTGYNEGQNVHIEYRWAEDKQEQMPALTADLVRRRVNVIVAAGGIAARAAKAATTVIPITFWIEGDPVETGLVTSLHRPGGNLTGVTTMGADLVLKRLELIHEVISSDTIAALIDPTTLTSETLIRELRATARSLSIQLHVLHASNEVEIESAFAALDKLQARGLVIGPGPFLLSRSEQLAALAIQYRMPTVFDGRGFAEAGGLMTYGGSPSDLYQQAGIYAGRILKGEKPADLPVQRSTKIDLLINLKTARALGLTVPITVLGRANDVIE